MIHEQPATPSYFFHGGFIDLGQVIKGAFKNCWEAIGNSKDGLVEQWGEIVDKIRYSGIKGIFTSIPNIFLVTFYLMRLIATAAFTPIVCFSITAIQIALLVLFFLLLLFCFLFITILDMIYCHAKAIASHCPVCQSKFSMPVYICHECGEEHDRLRPGYYGILRRECDCGAKLSTTFFNGREKLKAICPACKGYEIKGGGLHASWSIPVVGGPNSGKTCYINMTVMSLEKNAQKYNLSFEHVKTGRDEYEQNSQSLLKGYLPQKTEDRRLNYYQFYLTPKGATKQQVSLCDVAGELFNINDVSSDNINTQLGFRYSNAFMLIVDPLSIPMYREEVSKTTDLKNYKGSAQPIEEMLDTFIRTLQNIFGATDKDMRNTDVAVVFTKVDIPGLAQKIGDSAVNKIAPSLEMKVRYKIQNELCQQFLHEYEEDNFYNRLKSSFKNIQFFTCSALGHVKNGQPFVASNVEEPLLWLLGNKSSVLDKATKKITIKGG